MLIGILSFKIFKDYNLEYEIDRDPESDTLKMAFSPTLNNDCTCLIVIRAVTRRK